MSVATARPEEVAKFDALAARWWDPEGPMRPLHRQNPLRIGWIAERLARHHGGPPNPDKPLAGLRILDAGCGAGLAAEAMARLGAEVTGVDAAGEAISVARAHAAAGGLAIDYREGGPEDLGEARFDAVTALEVIEHVSDRPAFIRELAARLRPNGLLFVSTLNRTPRSLALAKFAAEYVLRWLPPGTHDWRMFVTPAELAASLAPSGLRVRDITGMVFDPLRGTWRTSRDVAMNYLVVASR